MKSCSVADLNKSYRAAIPVVLFIMLHKVVLALESQDDSPRCDFH